MWLLSEAEVQDLNDMKTPITYYGGKQSMLSIILPMIPEHNLYCEPFFGDGAVFFTKEPSKIEVINDTNREVVNFYRVAQISKRKSKYRCTVAIYTARQK